MKFTAGKFLRLERDIFQPTTQPTECGVLLDCERLMRPLAVPAVLEVVVKPMRGPLSRQRPRARVPSSPPSFSITYKLALLESGCNAFFFEGKVRTIKKARSGMAIA